MGMRTRLYTCIPVMLCCFIFFAASQVRAGSTTAFPVSFAPSAATVSITPVPDTAPGNPVRYNIDFSVRLFSISFAWGSVTFTGAKKETLPLQLKKFRAGDHSFYWDSSVPLGARDNATVVITYLSIPGGIFREMTKFKISPIPPTQNYIGSQQCMGCHNAFTPDVVNIYTQSGHYYALSSISYQAPTYPSFAPGVPHPPPGTAWGDISYVIGGYAWSANFSSADNGTILTGPEAQYNLASSYLGTPAGFVPYSPGTPDPGRFDCGPCHATGYVPEGSQDGLSGIAGTWTDGRVGCEACHGPGSAHAATPYAVKPELSSSKACADCHVRGSTSVVEASSGLIRHQQQAAELQASPMSFMQCTTCHNPHASAHYDAQAAGSAIVVACSSTSCHPGVTVGLNMSQLECTDCHMPHAVNAGATTTFADPANNVYPLGAMRSHLFKINVDAVNPGDMFSDNGTKLAVNASGKTAGLTVNFVCLGCHRTGGQAATSYTYDQAKSIAPAVHAQ